MGRDLQPTLIALTQWGDRWLHTSDGAPVKFIERASGEEIADVAVFSKGGRELKARELTLIPGPGATDKTRERLRQLDIAWKQRMAEANKN
jgi:hypothetical protein